MEKPECFVLCDCGNIEVEHCEITKDSAMGECYKCPFYFENVEQV